MNIYKMPNAEGPTDEQEKQLRLFMDELVDLCNKHRITISIGKIFFLHSEVFDKKLLDVAGFQYDRNKDMSFPVFVDRMSENKDPSNEGSA